MQTWMYWLLGWLGMGGWFAIEETWALRIKHTAQTDGTLSSMVWRLIRGRQWYHRIAFVAFSIGYFVLYYHFAFQPLH